MTKYMLVVVLALVGCGGAAAFPQSVPNSQNVEVGKSDAPPGSVEVGPIEGVHGNGCGGFGSAGTFEGAMVMLRNEAARRGANYIVLLSERGPHSETGCYDNRFVIRGIAYQLPAGGPPGAPPSRGSAPSPDPCDPPCSPGYECAQATCIALCNPTCSDDQICRQDRTCGPAEPLAP